MEKSTFDIQMCRTCRGRCCQGHPGIWVDPQRFFLSFFDGHIPASTDLATALSDRKLQLRAIDGTVVPSPMFDDDGCVFRETDGCRLPITERPCQCLALVPDIETLMQGEIHCTMPDGFRTGQALQRWADFWMHQSEN